MSMLYPLHFHPIYKRYLWGGRKFETSLGRTLGPGEITPRAGKFATTARIKASWPTGHWQGMTLADISRQIRPRIARPALSSIPIPFARQVSRRSADTFAASASQRCPSRPARSARFRQDRGVDHTGSRTREPDLCRFEIRRGSHPYWKPPSAKAVARIVCTLSILSRATVFLYRRERFTLWAPGFWWPKSSNRATQLSGFSIGID